MNLQRCLQELRRCAISLVFIILGVVLATHNAPAAEPSPALVSCNMIRNSLTILSTCPGPKAFRQPDQPSRFQEPHRKWAGGVQHISSIGTRSLRSQR